MHNLISLARCLEKGKSVIRAIEEIDKTPDRVLAIYDKIKACGMTTGWEQVATLEKFLGPHSVVWTVDDVGVIVLFLDDIPHVHVFFWDARLRGRERMCRLHAATILERFRLIELWTYIPQSSPVIAAFARRVGFRVQAIVQGQYHLKVNSQLLHLATGGSNGV